MIAALDRIAIVMMSAVGDAVHVLPVINAIKRARPQSHISWILQPGPATLVRGHESVDEILQFDRARGPRAYIDLRNQLASRRFDLALALQVYFKAGLVLAMTRAKVKLGFDRARARDLNWLFTSHRVPPHPMQHVQDQYLEFLRPLGIDPNPIEWKLGPWPDERLWQRDFFAAIARPAVSIVVATSKPEKDWMPERWAEVCDALYYDLECSPCWSAVGRRASSPPNARSSSARAVRRSRRSAAVFADSSRSSMDRRSCSLPTRGRCT